MHNQSDKRWTQVDRTSHIPLYIQIMEDIRERIESGHWDSGYQLPKEADLCKIYNVSNIVVRQALGELASLGLIVRIQGKGTFVSKPKIVESLAQRLTGFYHDMVDQGYEPKTEVLEQKIITAKYNLASKLNIDESERVFKLTRKRSIENVPIVLVTTYLPHKLCKGLNKVDFENNSLYETLENKYGLFISYGRRTIEAVPADEMEANLFGIDKGEPLILLESISFLEDGTPIEFYHAVHRGDRTRFEVELVRYKDRGTSRNLLNEKIHLPQGSALITELKGDSKLSYQEIFKE
jgi:GntR family transcriptional regulator